MAEYRTTVRSRPDPDCEYCSGSGLVKVPAADTSFDLRFECVCVAEEVELTPARETAMCAEWDGIF